MQFVSRPTKLGIVFLTIFLSMRASLVGITLEVTNTDNINSPGSIRLAIADANANPAITVIDLSPIQEDAYPDQAIINLTTSLSIDRRDDLTIRANSNLPRPILRNSIGADRIMRISSFSGGRLTLDHLEFRDGFSDLRGGAISYARLNTPEERHFSLVILNCHFENNIVNNPTTNAATGGAIHFASSDVWNGDGFLIIFNSSFVNNQAIGRPSTGVARGSAIYAFDTYFRLRDSKFHSNSTNARERSHGGTIALWGNMGGVGVTGNPIDTAEISRCEFIGNETEGASGTSGIVFFQLASQSENAKLLINRCSFAGNGLGTTSGPVIYAGKELESGTSTSTSGTLTITNSLFTDNEGLVASALMAGDEVDITLTHCTIAANRHNPNWGAAVFMATASSSISLDRSVVALNDHLGGAQIAALSPDIFATSSAEVESFGYNFLGSGTGLNAGIFQTSDQHGSNSERLDPLLAAFDDYGNGMMIMPPLAGGPLTERIPGPYGLVDPFRLDLTGVQRSWNMVDIGAVQLSRINYDNWANASGLPTGDDRLPDTDYSGDGLSNRMSYFLGLNPLVFNPNPIRVFPDSENLFLEFVRSSQAGFDHTASNGLSEWLLEYSDDLETWSPFPAEPELLITESGASDYVSYRYSVDASESTHRFFRLRVE